MSAANKQRFCVVMILGTLISSAFSDTGFLLNNGDRITGRIVSETTNQVVLATAWGGEWIVPVSQIAGRTNASSVSPALSVMSGATTNGSLPDRGGKVSSPGGALLPGSKNNGLANTNKTFGLDVQVGASVQYNQVSSDNFSGLLKGVYSGERFRNITEIQGAYGRAGTKVSINRMSGSDRSEYDFGKSRRAFFFDALAAGYDQVREVDLTYDDSLGVGYKFIKRKNFLLNADVGVNYQEEFFSDGTHPSYVSLRFSETMAWTIMPRLTLEEKLEFYPHIVEMRVYRFRFECGVSYKLNESGSVYLMTSVVDIFDKKPARGVLPNDLQIVSRIGLKF
jgi:RNase P/RNase MRP subunit p29